MAAAAIPALITGGASVFTGALSYNAQRQAARQQAELIAYQKKFLDRDLARDNAFAPAIDRTLQEYVDEPKAVAQTAAVVARASIAIESEMARAKRRLRECSSVYCAPSSCAQEAQLAVQAAIAKSDAVVAAIRSEEARVRVLNDKRRADIVTAVGNATRGAFVEGQRGIQALLGYYQRQQEQAARAFAGSLRELGYQATRYYNTSNAQRDDAVAWRSAGDEDRRRIEEAVAQRVVAPPNVSEFDTGNMGEFYDGTAENF